MAPEFYKTSNGILYQEDCLEVMSNLQSESIDLIVADPPYNSKAIEWDYKDDEWQFSWLTEAKRILKPNGSIYVFFAPLFMYGIEGFVRQNFNLRNILVWFHPNLYGANISYGKDRYKSTWEVILYAVKGKKGLFNIQQRAYLEYGRSFDVIQIGAVLKNRLIKTQKPEKLIGRFIFYSSNEKDTVLDPFIGSGTTAIASEKMNRKWVGIEINPEYCKLIIKRLDPIIRQQRLQFNAPS